MTTVTYLIHMFVEAEREFDDRVTRNEPVREVVERAETAIMRLMVADPTTTDEEAAKTALLLRVKTEQLFPAWCRGLNRRKARQWPALGVQGTFPDV